LLLFAMRGLQVGAIRGATVADGGPRQFIDEIKRGWNFVLAELAAKNASALPA